MPRPERQLRSSSGPVEQFAQALRVLRREAGSPGYRELARRSGYSTTTLSDAAGGRRLPGLPVTLAYAQACGGDPAEWRERWQAVVTELAARDAVGDPPYLGLASFRAADADRFFGREKLVADLLERLADTRFLMVVGASGSGKSSVLRAGLVPAAARQPVVFTPGTAPAARLDAHLASVTGPVLLVVDQFEEVFTLCRDADQRAGFVSRLLAEATAPDRATQVVIGLRADFYTACAQFPALVSAMAQQTVLIGPMSEDELRHAITRPAGLAGLTVERALVTQVVADAGGQPGALPLVSHALLETWRQRQGSILTVAGYQAAGGVRGAIAGTAERVYDRFDPAQRGVLRQIMLRLTALGEGTEDTRRRVRRADLGLDGADAVIDELVQARLLIVHDDLVEIAHEALIGAWPRLRQWLTSDREALRVHRQLIESAALWQSLDRDDGALYRGTRLAIAREWAERSKGSGAPGNGGAPGVDELTAVERDFLDSSVRAELAERTAAGRRSRQLRVLTGALAALLVLAVVAAATAAWQWGAAVDQRQQAVSRLVAAQALDAAESDVPEAMRLSIEAYRAAPTVEARGALLSLASRQVYSGQLQHAGMVKDLAFARDGTTLATAGQDGRVVLWDVARRTERAALTGHGAAVRGLAFAPDSRWLVSGSLNGTVIIWDLDRGVESIRLRHGGGLIESVAVSPDGSTVAAVGEERRIMLWRAADGTALGELDGHGGESADLAFSPDGRLLVSAGDDGTAVLWDLAGRRRLRTLPASPLALQAAAFSPDGRILAVAGADRDITTWDVATGRRLHVLRGHTAVVSDVAFTPDGATLVSASFEGQARVWDVKRGRRLATLRGHTSGMYAVAVSPDGRTIAGGSRDRTALLWDRPSMPMAGHVDEVHAVAVTADGGTVSSAGKDGTVVLWDPAAATPRATLSGDNGARPDQQQVADAVIDARGRWVAAVSHDGRTRIWAPSDGRPRHALGGRSDSLLAAAAHPDGAIVATGGVDATVYLWDVERGVQLAALPLSDQVRAVSFSADGRTLVCAAHDGVVTVWDVHDRTLRATLRDRPGLTSAELSRDAALIAVGRADGTAALWDVRRRATVAVLPGHAGPVGAVAFSPDGRLLATASLDKKTQLWRVAERRLWATLTGSTSGVNDLAWSHDSRTLYTASGDQLVTRWTVEPRAAVRRSCTSLARDFPGQPRPDC